MSYGPVEHQRRSIRPRGYDYAQAGAYFVTIRVQDRACLFGEVVNGEMRLNEYGRIVQAAWADLPSHYAGMALDGFVVMPNHVHGIVMLMPDVGAGLKPAPAKPRDAPAGAGLKPAPTTTGPAPTMGPPPRYHGLPEIIRGFKTFSARRINECRGSPGLSVWQRNYYEHIVRNEESLDRIRQYILDNPARWDSDRENPLAVAPETERAWEAA